MNGSIKLFKIFGILIKIHATFFLLLLVAFTGTPRWIFLMFAVFFFVTMHEICHSLVARRFGIEVREITLFPIGGVASMTGSPDKPVDELLISLAGPLSNIAVIVLFFYPMRYLVGDEILFHRLSTASWPLTFAYAYWINLMLALFNMLPAFPMDGGRILRAILASWLGYLKATRIAVAFGHIFALAFAYFGIVDGNIMLVIIAIFVYTAASGEGRAAEIKEILKNSGLHDILRPGR